METFSALLAFCAGNSPVTGWALVFSLTCAWVNSWANSDEAGDLRRHCAHYDVNLLIWNMDSRIHPIKHMHTSLTGLFCCGYILDSWDLIAYIRRFAFPTQGWSHGYSDGSEVTLAHSRSIPTLQWRHNEYDGVPNHRCLSCLLNRLFTHRSKKAWKLRVTGLCEGNSPCSLTSL